MPPRKSDVRPATPVAAEEASPPAKAPQAQDKQDKQEKKDKDKDKGKGGEDPVTIEDLNLPKSIITRLAKGILPPNTQIQGNAILALSKSATVFISYLASHANENTVAAGKKTILPADVFKALDDTEFSFLKEPLEAEFAKFNAIQTEKRTSYRQKVRASASKHGPGDDTDMADTTIASEASASSGPRAKKARVDPSAGDDEEVDAIVNEDDDVDDDDDDENEGDEDAQDDEDDEEAVDEDDEEDGGEGEASGDETQDALEERRSREEADEALEGDESD
ncbi:histone-like transcription factor (CBF/NF-Y) and archaeal histone domain-containing protein [Trichoderma breve]|uniref:DNA polymerase epsilon subunit D n=1 Tax=Trichoderma breve TaxID=2034170 RepID=A0A9W9ECK2_9HYPO|nr:histone-like transcription factor (CBF/NF-Y) and archaeal histone domain-containing protein [Trichoderma breve]KAJ4864252.1 histone-like transcription factor (CBF/NF-Y) and archaeal histone domain-containing protein [Trichoderma breve]